MLLFLLCVLCHDCARMCMYVTGIGDAGALGLQGYPFISTGRANYSPELTRLLSQQANWQVLQLQPQLQQLLRGTNITVKSPAQ